jgi:hypothetical protein
MLGDACHLPGEPWRYAGVLARLIRSRADSQDRAGSAMIKNHCI